MALPFSSPIAPMLAEAADDVPEGDGWRYEPKWDGFRAIVFRDGESVHLCSRNGQPLERYFPELLPLLRESLPSGCVVDGELLVPGDKGLDFDALSARIHPAASRVEKLSLQTPASFVAFDLLALGEDDVRAQPFSQRRGALRTLFTSTPRVFITPQTTDPAVAKDWFRAFEGAGLDGVIARREELPYQEGERVLVKVKHGRAAEVVVGGYREGKTPGTVGSLLLGLYDESGVLHYVGHTSSFSAKEKKALVERLAPLLGGTSFGEGRTPGAPNRWNKGKATEWVPLRPELVAEVRYESLQSQRFRHSATFLKWRPDKAPAECVFAQLEPPNPFSLARIVELAQRS